MFYICGSQTYNSGLLRYCLTNVVFMDTNKMSTTKYRWLWDYVHEHCQKMFICNMNSNIGYHTY